MKGSGYNYTTSNYELFGEESVDDFYTEYSSVENEEPQSMMDGQNNSLTSINGEDNVKCDIREELKQEEFSFQLDNEKLAQAIIYSEILGKPKCKTRRRG